MKWTPNGLGGYGNMGTPAVSRVVGGTDGLPHLMLNCDMGGAYLSKDLGQTWQMIHYAQLRSNMGVRPAFSPTYGQSGDWNIFAGSAFGQIRSSADGGRTFKKADTCPGNAGFGNERLHGEIAIDPYDPKVMLVGGSEDFNFVGYALFADPQRCANIELDRGRNSIWRSDDAGCSWKQVVYWGPNLAGDSPEQIQEVLGFPLAFHIDQRFPDAAANERIHLAATQAGVLISKNGGGNWGHFTSRGLPLETNGKPLIRSFAGHSADGHLRLYCTVASRRIDERPPEGGVYTSVDCAPWRRLKVADDWIESPEDGACHTVQFHRIMASGTMAPVIQVLAANSGYSEENYKEGVHSSVYRSRDGGENWERTFFPFPPTKNGFYKKHNVTHNWATVQLVNQPNRDDLIPSVSEEPGNDAAVSPDDSDVILRVGTRCYVHRSDPEPPWLSADSATTKASGPQPPDQNTGWTCNGLVVTAVWHYSVDPHDPQRHFIAYTDCNFARSTDAGESWVWGKFDVAGEEKQWQNTVYEFAFDPKNKDRMWAAFSSLHDIPNGNVVLFFQPEPTEADKIGRVGYSCNGGQDWKLGRDTVNEGISTRPVTTDAKTESIRPLTSIVYAEDGQCVLYAAVFEDGIYQAADEGGDRFKWKSITHNLKDNPNRRFFRLVAHQDGTLFVLVTPNTTETANGSGCFGRDNDGVGLFRLDKGSDVWKPVGDAHCPRLDWPRDFAVDPRNSRRIFLAASEPRNVARLVVPPSEGSRHYAPEQSGAYQWDEASDTWRRLPLHGMPISYRHFGVYLHPENPHWLYLTLVGEIGRKTREHSGLWLSRDSGHTCQPFNELPFMHVHRVSFDKRSPDVMYVSTNGGGVWRGPADICDEEAYTLD